MSAETPASREVPRQNRFTVWRQTRPFWAGLFTVIGGLPIAYLPYGDMRLGNITLAMKTTAGAGALIIGVLLVTLGLTMWFQPIVRVFAGVATIILGLVSIPVSNFGGLVVGFLFALVGGGMSIAWAPAPPVEDALGPPYDEDPEESAGTVPEQYGTEYHATETTIDADGGRNSAA
ncbi:MULTISPECIES: DUF6114 domain-containing protein [unclassified Streptomyces]|uniref:DUF6114 domain-containing protein n=1 Tax=unclassified Streptomyces TaxID=2593676 RepID=UPI0016617064|nr:MULTISPECIES: DUF6114 domain-containing protein [unclassified Streptomyces]MBD0710699.1 hypothetical protein [Streptomyces sp. CBMA291]MBD0715546.1 hypothetical protein [Streptomyces sp. CBMA370]